MKLHNCQADTAVGDTADAPVTVHTNGQRADGAESDDGNEPPESERNAGTALLVSLNGNVTVWQQYTPTDL